MNQTNTLRQRLEQPEILVMSGCYDALSARLSELAGFEAVFMSGFGVAAMRLAMPDTGLISFAELRDQARDITQAVRIPVLGDGDTGFGNPLNVKRTVSEYARAGLACVMIEDQLAPKRCGHTRGKQVVEREEALSRIEAAVEAREQSADILVMARTDARATHGLEEAIWRCQQFRQLGADITFLEAPKSREEMQRFCDAVPGHKMANLVEDGDTPLLSHQDLQQMGYAIAVYPLTLLSCAAESMMSALKAIRAGESAPGRMGFEQLRSLVGFDHYDAELRRLADKE